MKDRISMDDFTDDIPSEFTDEDKWFVFFTKPMLLAIAIGVIFTVIVANIFKFLFGFFWPIMIIGLIATAIVVGMMMIPASTNNTMKGGDDSVFVVQIKKWYRRKNRAIYVKDRKSVV